MSTSRRTDRSERVVETDGDGFDKKPLALVPPGPVLHCRADGADHERLEDVLPEDYTFESPDGIEWRLPDRFEVSYCPWCHPELDTTDGEAALAAFEAALRVWYAREGKEAMSVFERADGGPDEQEQLDDLRDRVEALEATVEEHEDALEWAKQQRFREEQRKQRWEESRARSSPVRENPS